MMLSPASSPARCARPASGAPCACMAASRCVLCAVEEVKQLLPRDTVLKPRTYRIGANRTVFIGGVARLDVSAFRGGTLYLTVWASDLIPLHMGKTFVRGESVHRPGVPWVDKAGDFWAEHVGAKLNPPQPASKESIPKLVPVEVSTCNPPPRPNPPPVRPTLRAAC